jgi:hypothetical protein
LTVQAQVAETKASTTEKVRRKREDRRKEDGTAKTHTEQAVASESAGAVPVKQNAQLKGFGT